MGDAEHGAGTDRLGVACACGHRERGFGTTVWRVDRWDAEQTAWAQRRVTGAPVQDRHFRRLGIKPYLVTETTGNLITNAGYTRIGNLFTAQGATQAFDAAHCRIGAGNGSTAVAYTDTDLSAVAGSANRWFQLVSAVFTIGATRTWTVAATFGTADGNFTWNEFGIDQGTASGNTVTAILLNHALSSQGTKASGQTWTATATITWT
jgi:hypothetical protein